ncbi:rhomboid family intramembrane serine protease [Ideonella sp. 4Y16]|uniref:rhomboid family intramembrane serine protease n=1 Tax=Ideonella alba TaxID=2824118 RepID=UPI001B395846|nr:rhomboid family intramembrane serine protease [Ideonella alba]MBQ0943276.1 rhomboid family intramembrane serine protease [Ideonella alba]
MNRWAWPGVALALALLAGALWGADRARWDWQPALAAAQPWRAFTAAGVHWSPMHLAMNLGATALLAWLGWRAGAGPREALAWALAWPLTQLGLLMQPTLLHFGGLSGVLHAGVAVLIWRLVRHSHPRERAIGLALAAGLLLKLALEAPWRGATRAVEGWDFALAPGAHASGALAGAVAALLICGWTRHD